jgi:hypothetical protein
MTRRNRRHQRRPRISRRKSLYQNPRARRLWVPTALGKSWNRFWFRPTEPTTLGAIRLCTGLLLLYAYLSWAPWTLDFIGPHAWIDASAVQELRTAARPLLATGSQMDHRWWTPSVWFYVQDPRWIWGLYAVFLLAILCLALGLMSCLGRSSEFHCPELRLGLRAGHHTGDADLLFDVRPDGTRDFA